MARRTFLLASLSGLGAVALASCSFPDPQPPPTPTSTPPTSAPPTPIAGVPEPVALRRSRWATDPFARGAFSFDAVGATPELREALAEPVGERVVIAGEASSRDAPGTLQGARDSGLRAAAHVVRLGEPGERVAIVGAGVAGLTAARALVDEGFEVVVIEGRDRLGGRIDSVDDDGMGRPVELGAMIVGDDPALLDELEAASVDVRPLDRTTLIRTVAGIAVADSLAGLEAIETAQAWALTQPSDVSLASALAGSGVVPLPREPDADGVSAADWLRHALASQVEPATGAPPTRASARAFDQDRLEASGAIVTGRLADWIDRLADGIDVVLASAVVRIAYDDRRVSLRLASGESLSVDRAIVTAPLGVLKTDTLRFEPALPLLHQRAISVLGMGVVDVVWLRFDEPFWRADATAPTDAAQPEFLTVVGRVPTVAGWIDVGVADGSDEPVLVGIIAAEQARRLEELDDEAFRSLVLGDLEPFATPTG